MVRSDRAACSVRRLAPQPGCASNQGELFAYQKEAVNALADWWHGDNRNGVLCLPTGAGKTRTAVDFLLAHVVARKVRVLWLAHRKELVDQAIATLATRSHLANMDFRIGRFGPKNGSRTNEIVHVLVGSIRTLVRGDNLAQAWKRQGGFDLVVVDECHHAPAPTWKKLIQKLVRLRDTLKVLGLSATPTRRMESEKVALWDMFGEPIFERGARELIDGGYLARPEIVTLPTGRNFTATAVEALRCTDVGGPAGSLLTRIANDELRNRFTADAIAAAECDWGKDLGIHGDSCTGIFAP